MCLLTSINSKTTSSTTITLSSFTAGYKRLSSCACNSIPLMVRVCESLFYECTFFYVPECVVYLLCDLSLSLSLSQPSLSMLPSLSSVPNILESCIVKSKNKHNNKEQHIYKSLRRCWRKSVSDDSA